jgi:hypothetical protein
MGAAASIEPELFNEVKGEYEAKKAAGASDEELYEAIKTFIESKSAAKSASAESEAPAPEPVATPSVEEAKPVEDGGAAGGAEVEAVPVEAAAVAAE